MTPLAVRMSMPMALHAVLKKECVDEPASRWIREGLAGWLWREVVIQTVSAKAAGHYAVTIAQLPMARAGDEAINLEIVAEKRRRGLSREGGAGVCEHRRDGRRESAGEVVGGVLAVAGGATHFSELAAALSRTNENRNRGACAAAQPRCG